LIVGFQAAIIALTATATPIVQDDIAVQLALAAPSRFIHGFRRDNLAVEVGCAKINRSCAIVISKS
jgi:superfamily II DNA helicase RecQ